MQQMALGMACPVVKSAPRVGLQERKEGKSRSAYHVLMDDLEVEKWRIFDNEDFYRAMYRFYEKVV
jgi:hypothetical protein